MTNNLKEVPHKRCQQCKGALFITKDGYSGASEYLRCVRYTCGISERAQYARAAGKWFWVPLEIEGV